MAPIDLSFYRGKRVFLTGHTGFKGSWLATWLLRLGAEVRGYALRPDTEPNLFEALALAERVDGPYADINDLSNLKGTMDDFRPDIVFHLAAQPLVRRSYLDPVETFRTNVMGTVNLLEAVRECDSVRTCVVITSDKCYLNNEWVFAYRENDPMGGSDPYSASKGAAELVVNSYRSSFLIEGKRPGGPCGIATARAGNVIGGGDWSPDRIVPDTIHSLRQGSIVQLRNPRSIRPWQHVLEPLYGYLRLGVALSADPKGYGSAWNFGPAKSDVTVSRLVELMIRQWGEGSWEDASDPKGLHEAQYLRLDSTKANNLLSWSSSLDIREAVALTVDWYKDHLDGADMWQCTSAQISNYEKLVRLQH